MRKLKKILKTIFKKTVSDIRLFFRNPEKPSIISFDREPDYDLMITYYFENRKTGDYLRNNIETLPTELRAELKMRMMELEQQRKSMQRNVEMLWRAQILTALTLAVSIVGVVVAITSHK